MALVDGVLDHGKLARVLEYSRALDIEADYLTDLVEAASGHWPGPSPTCGARISTASSAARREGLDPAAWIRPYGGANADPALVARYDALGKLPQNTFGKALWDFDKTNGYAFPGDPTALNAAFATPHDSTHVISGYDTSCARRDPGLDLHRRHASDQSHERPHPAGDLQRPSRREVQRRRPRRPRAASTPTSSGTPGRAAAR